MRSYLAATLLLATLTRPATAQTTIDPRLATSVAALRPGSSIRIASFGSHPEGRFINATSNSLVFATSYGDQTVPLSAVDTLWTAHRATRRGAVIGAVVGGVALTAFGVLFVSALCEAPGGCQNDYATLIGGGLALGGGGGALLGAGIGSLFQRWRRTYP